MSSATELLSLVNNARQSAEGDQPELVQKIQGYLKGIDQTHLEAARFPTQSVDEKNLERLAEHLLALETLSAAENLKNSTASGSQARSGEPPMVIPDPVISEGGIMITLAAHMPPMDRKSVRPWVESQVPEQLVGHLQKSVALPGGRKLRQDFVNITESGLEVLKSAFAKSGTVAPIRAVEFAKRKAYESETAASKRSRASAVGNLNRTLDVVETVSSSGDPEFMRLAMSAVVTSQRVAPHGLREVADDPLARSRGADDR
ncbi:unnamed protein product [Prorocentrum cordatum]|uniref:Uncharacterized protein n=1 Tax=Prorocentrum cordatum TaxID=2364126 RepID=A0ABN9QC64_9DINO|nr:unnamed protein product [Polarella glacialis]